MAKQVTFISLKFKKLRIVIDPQAKKEVQGRLVASSLNGLFPAGYTAEFENGLYTTSDETVIQALEEHPYYGAMFARADKEGAVAIGGEGARMINLKKETAEEIASTCTVCGFKAKNADGLKIHMRTHNK